MNFEQDTAPTSRQIEMSEEINKIIYQTVHEIINVSVSDKSVRKLAKKHDSKVHFIPVRYRILGGILQGLNIKFGNFIEMLMQNIIEIDPGVTLLPESGKKLALSNSPETTALIDRYMADRQRPDSPDDCTEEFDHLLDQIISIEQNSDPSKRRPRTYDVDALFRTDKDITVFVELKYNDDHDTGKFVNINSKFLKTWAGLVVQLGIKDKDQLLSIIYYFNPAKRYGPIYTPSRNIMRGPQFFQTFLSTAYTQVGTQDRTSGKRIRCKAAQARERTCRYSGMGTLGFWRKSTKAPEYSPHSLPPGCSP